jgi:UDP-2-acetamido-3-amino-2,3-dideoxy-glucuronate N-acetyltransferase
MKNVALDGNPVRLGVIGAGVWGANVIRTCAQLGALAAVCDSDFRRLDEMGERHPEVERFASAEVMISRADLDGLIVASPAKAHASLALMAIDAGMDVLVEKPLALNVLDAQRVVKAARLRDCKLMVGHVLLYHPGITCMLQAIEDGQIGDVRFVRCRRLNWGRLRTHEDVWWSFAPHDVAVILEVMRDVPVSASCSAGSYVTPGIADVVYAHYIFADGRAAHVEVSWLNPERVSQIEVFGTSGILSFNDGRGESSLTLTPGGSRESQAGPSLWRDEPRTIAVPKGEPLALELQAFCRAIHGDETPRSDGEEGLAVVRTLAMLQGAEKS